MGNTEEFYRGGSYDPAFSAAYGKSEGYNYGESFLNTAGLYSTSQFGFPSDPTTANQLQKVSEKISTGTKTIEVSGLGITGGGPMKHLSAIPKQHFTEINRLKKLVGVDLTFHGPLVEATGFQGEQGWKEAGRLQAEREMKFAVQRAHQLDPNGNIVVTFHSSASLMEPESVEINEDGKPQLKKFWAIDEYEGHFNNIAPKLNHLKKETSIQDAKHYIKEENKNTWYNALDSINFSINKGAKVIEEALHIPEHLKDRIKKEDLLQLYKMSGTEKGRKFMEDLKKKLPNAEDLINTLTYGDLNIRQAYQQFQSLYNRAYEAAKNNPNAPQEIAKLNKFRDDLAPNLESIENPEKMETLARELQKGIQILSTINTPILKSMKEWAIDKSSTTFANVALGAYKEFAYNKSKNTAPIISIENAPFGTGLSSGEDLKKMVEQAREKFAREAKEKFGLSASQAKQEAEKILGATWDVGHINMMRSKGYSEKDVIKQTAEIAKYVKHVHLSDNFGLDHTELPMGMGNVPTKKMLDLIQKYNKKVKMIAETGDWFSRQGGLGLTGTPMMQTLGAFGSPVYSTGMSPYWNQAAGATGGYWSGQGNINPQIHHSLYGSGFSNLPLEFGGQMAGQSRASGAPIE